MKILALTTILLSLTSGNSNLEECQKAIDNKRSKFCGENIFPCMLPYNEIKIHKINIHQDCNCQDLRTILIFNEVLSDVEDYDDSYFEAKGLYRSKKCDQKN